MMKKKKGSKSLSEAPSRPPAGPRPEPRAVEITNRFVRDLAREKKGKSAELGKKLDALVQATVELLAADEILPAKYFDHALLGNWVDHCDCHVRPDLLLIYRKYDDALQLVRLGSHSELGL